MIIQFRKKVSLSQLKKFFPSAGHYELTRSERADEYVWKEETRVEGTQFEIGTKPTRRNNSHDWDDIRSKAQSGDLEGIDSDIFIRYYRSLTAIASDFQKPLALERETIVYYGETGVGKSRRAWAEAGLDAYAKDPRSKFWCGYKKENNIVIDEFRGGIDIAHLLRWLDRYPVRVEIKGGSRPFCGTKIWITSNLHPDDWYPDLDKATRLALLRRLKIEKLQ